MTEKSGFWNTEGVSPVGDQLDGYNEIVWSDAASILASCSGFEGVGASLLNALEVTATDLNEVTVDIGGAVVDGKWYKNDAGKAVVIPSAVGGGNTRIDRIVLRCSWAGYTVRIHRIAGTDAASPTAPAITQTSGTTYDIMLAQVLVTTGGVVTVTDERVWAAPQVDDNTIEVSGRALQVKDDGITNAKLADPYDVYSVLAAPDGMYLTVRNSYLTFPVPDVHNGKNVVRLTARLKVTSSIGDVTVRVYNETDSVVVGTITITAGNTIGFTTSITNPALATNDILRIDVTAKGSGTKGLTVLVKVDKS